jgi:hypothetical protein
MRELLELLLRILLQMRGASMRFAIALLSGVILLAAPGFAQTKVESDDIAHHPFETDFPAGGQLSLHIRSGDIQVVGSDDNKVGVRVTGKRGSQSTDVTVRFDRSDKSGTLHVSGGPHDEVTITVQVPRNSNLYVRVPAGNVEVKDVAGDKDIELHAGNLTIGVGDANAYAHVEASVTTGSIEAEPFGEDHGGLFRSFEKSGSGKYRLVAHVGAGDLTLE